MAFWSDPSAQPSFWPEDVPYGNVKRTSKKSLCIIIHVYLKCNNNNNNNNHHHHQGEDIPSYRDRSPHGSPRRTARPKDHSRHCTNLVIDDVSDYQFSNLQTELTDIDTDTSSETFFPGLQQPVSTHSHQDPEVPTPSLATPVGTKPIEPIFEFTRILSHNVRKQSLGE